jgi:hypothetical protein
MTTNTNLGPILKMAFELKKITIEAPTKSEDDEEGSEE